MNTNQKGDIAKVAIIKDLTNKGGFVFTPISEHGVVDLVVVFQDIAYKLQSKYSCSGKIGKECSFHSGGKNNKIKYKTTDFDYYAVYLAELDICIYVPNYEQNFRRIHYKEPNFSGEYLWYEDYLNIPNTLNIRQSTVIREYKEQLKLRKVERPTKDELQILLWKMPATKIAEKFKVSDRLIGQWAKNYGIEKPSRGYWSKFK